MTRGKLIVLGMLILLAGLVVLLVKEPGSTAPPETVATVEEEITPPPPTIFDRVGTLNDDETQVSPAMQQTKRALPDGRSLQVIVQNEERLVLTGVEVRAKIKEEKGKSALTNFNQTFITDSDGIASVPLPNAVFEQLELVVSLSDHAARKVIWDITTGDTIPQSYTVTLKRGVYLSGIVVDPEGNPIQGTRVQVSRFWRGGEDRVSKGEDPAFSTQRQTTDAEGRWTARDLPAELLYRISVEASHPDFISTRVSLDSSDVESQLRAGKHKLVLARGLAIHGRVLTESGEPLVGANVWAGRRFHSDRQSTKSDEQGGFSFRNVKDGKVAFSATATGFAPQTKTFTIADGTTEEIILQLAPGSEIYGVVRDDAGEPIQGVRVALEGGPGEDSYDGYEFSQTTGSDGSFKWDSAPKVAMPFYFGKPGYLQKRGVRLKPDEENVVTMHPNRQVQGQVVDAETGEPVKQFRVSIGRMMGERFFSSSNSGKDFTSEEGRFTNRVTMVFRLRRKVTPSRASCCLP